MVVIVSAEKSAPDSFNAYVGLQVLIQDDRAITSSNESTVYRFTGGPYGDSQ